MGGEFLPGPGGVVSRGGGPGSLSPLESDLVKVGLFARLTGEEGVVTPEEHGGTFMWL